MNRFLNNFLKHNRNISIFGVILFFLIITFFNKNSFVQAANISVTVNNPTNNQVISTNSSDLQYSLVFTTTTNIPAQCKYIFNANFPSAWSDNSLTTMTPSTNGTSHATVKTIANNQAHTLRVKCQDSNDSANFTTVSTVNFTVGNPNPPSSSPTVVNLTTSDPLTYDVSSMQSGQSVTINWSTLNANYCNINSNPINQAFNYTAGSTSGGILSSGSHSEIVMIPPIVKTYKFSVYCENTSLSQSDTKELVFTVTNTPVVSGPAPKINSFSADPTSIDPGQNVNVSWNVQDVSSCTASSVPALSGNSGWSGSLSTSTGVQSKTVLIPGPNTQSLKITCLGTGSQSSVSVDQEISVPIKAPPTHPQITLSANPTQISTAGGSSVLSWNITSSTPITSCTRTPAGVSGWSNLNNTTSGSVSVSPSFNTTYSLSCTNSIGTSSQNVTVFYNAGPVGPNVLINDFSAFPPTVSAGATSNLAWSGSGADTCVLSGGTLNETSNYNQNSNFNDSRIVSPTETTSYTLTCSNSSGQSKNSSLTVVFGGGSADGATQTGDVGSGLVGFRLVPNCSNPNDPNDLFDKTDPSRGLKTSCDFDDLIELIKNFIDLMLLFIVPIVLVVGLVTGIKYLTSGGKTNAAAEAKAKFADLFKGIAIMLLAWIAIATVLRILGVPDAYSLLAI